MYIIYNKIYSIITHLLFQKDEYFHVFYYIHFLLHLLYLCVPHHTHRYTCARVHAYIYIYKIHFIYEYFIIYNIIYVYIYIILI
jgi:hypothetical protein